MLLTIHAHHLPGRDWCDQHDVHVGLQVGREAAGLARGDVASAQWTTEVQRTPGGDFRGPAVHGKKGERFLYLVWVAGPDRIMFRRLKLMLADVPAAAEVSTVVSLTDARGEPRCGRLTGPEARWSVAS